MTEGLPRRTEKPWGYELLYAETARYVGKIIFVKKGHRLSLQYHRLKDESMYILSGKARIDSGADEANLGSNVLEEGGVIHLAPETRHRVEALEDTTLLEVSTPELQDVVRLQDDYGRAEKP
jgi:quercetin dioxygenase-like cupin family protein